MALTSALQHHQLLTAESEGIWLEKEKLKEKLKALQFKYDQMEIAMDSTVPVDQHDALNVQLSVLHTMSPSLGPTDSRSAVHSSHR